MPELEIFGAALNGPAWTFASLPPEASLGSKNVPCSVADVGWRGGVGIEEAGGAVSEIETSDPVACRDAIWLDSVEGTYVSFSKEFLAKVERVKIVYAPPKPENSMRIGGS